MSTAISPAVAQLELTVRLRERRKDLQLTTSAVAKYMGFSPNYWSAVENDRTILASDKLTKLNGLFDFDDEAAGQLAELHRAAKQPRWWTKYADLLDDNLMQLFGLEAGAEWVRTHEGRLITGLLQTQEYAEAVIGADPVVSTVTMKQRWELRKRRQQRLTEDDPLRLTALMSEAALMQHFGDAAVLRGQLGFLATAIEDLSETLDVRILPFDRSPLGMTGASTLYLLDFCSTYLPTVVWRDAVTPIGFAEQPEEVETLRVSFLEAMEESSLDREESLAMIERRIADLS